MSELKEQKKPETKFFYKIDYSLIALFFFVLNIFLIVTINFLGFKVLIIANSEKFLVAIAPWLWMLTIGLSVVHLILRMKVEYKFKRTEIAILLIIINSLAALFFAYVVSHVD